MPSVAILYYSQTGQSQRIAESLGASYASEGSVVKIIPIRPENPYSFPWKIGSFFEQMPYCIEGITPEIEEMNPLAFQDVEKIVLVHPVWFLSPSLPIQKFFNLPGIEYILKNKKVVQILTCRNMWFTAAKKTRELILKAGAHYCGHMVLEDTSPNWASLITTPRWMFSGKKEAFAIFPPAGISEESYSDFSKTAYTKIENFFSNFNSLQTNLEKLDRAKSLSICLEIFGHRFIFKPWAKIVIKAPRVFRGLLLVGFRINLVLFLLVTIPLAEIVSRIARYPFRSYASKQQLSLRGSL